MHQLRRSVRGLVVVLATVAVGIGAAPVGAGAAHGPKIVVAPSAGLVSGQKVHVTGSAFPTQTEVAGVECPTGATDPMSCDLNNVAFATTDAHGGFAATFVMHRTLLGADGLSDCAPDACELLFAPAEDFTTQAVAPVGFDPSVPLPPTTATAAPSTDLADGQVLKVGATGFTADPQVYVAECVVANFFCAGTIAVFTQPNGSLTTKFRAERTVTDATGTRVDCASSPTACELLVIDINDVDYHAAAPLAFDPKLPPPPPPSIKVHPATGLPYYARVTVYGKHFTPGDFLILQECTTKGPAACTALDFPQPDAYGAIQDQPMLVRKFVDDFTPGSKPVDCAAPHTACALEIQSASDGSTVSVPVTFDPEAPVPPKPSAAIHPAGPYQDQQTVTVTGRHFAPRAGFGVIECASSISSESCLFEFGNPTFTSSTGSLSTSYQLFGVFDPSDPTTDCTAIGVQCTLEVSSEGDAFVDLPLTFTAGTAAASASRHAQVVRYSATPAAGWARAGVASCAGGWTIRRALQPGLSSSFRSARACATFHRVRRG